MSVAGFPVWVMAIAIVGVPVAIAVFFGAFAFGHLPHLVFRCRRCDAVFRRAAHRDFPAACPACGARDWNA